jgi:hypothetical protein
MTVGENFEIKTSIHTNGSRIFEKNSIQAKANIDFVYEKERNVLETTVSIKNLKKKRKFAEYLENPTASLSDRDFCYESKILRM